MIDAIIGWARLASAHRFDLFHAYTGDAGGVVLTACPQRWLLADDAGGEDLEVLDGRDRELDDNGRPLPKCRACLRAAERQREQEHYALVRPRLLAGGGGSA